jgi:hypothetical protein
MSHWNYRVIEIEQDVSGEKVVQHGIHEVYYDDSGKPNGYTPDPVAVVSFGEDGEPPDLPAMFARMKTALDKPTLKASDFPAAKE